MQQDHHEGKMLSILYEFHVIVGEEDAFREAWAETTKYIYQNFRSLGSRLHRQSDGSFVAYAQWPDEETFDADHLWSSEGRAIADRLRATIRPDKKTVMRKLFVDCDLLQTNLAP